jgi:HPt (histidine-containing phosphotransfer) domain-containing protein
MTAHALVEERQRCLDAGMNDHVSKPIDPDALFSTLLRWAKPSTKQTTDRQAAPARADDEVTLPEIAGINVADGVKRVAGNKRLYRDLLTQFAARQGDTAAEISASITNRDLKLAERIAHTVKGVAGNIGITEVQSAAQRLEKAIREQSDSVPSLLDEFAASLSTQVDAIRRALRESAPTMPQETRTSPFNGEAASGAITRLRTLLDASDGAAEDAFHSLQAAVGGAVEKSELDALRAFINGFDFEAALVKLDEIAKVCARNGDK